MGKILAKTVSVWDVERGKRIKFHRGDELPEEYEDKVTNPRLFQEFYAGTGDELDDEPVAPSWHKGLTIPKLLAIADELDLELEKGTKKAQIIEAIETYRSANPDEEDFASGDAD